MKLWLYALGMCQSMFCALPFPWHGWEETARDRMLLCLPVIMIVEYFLALGMAMLSSAVTVYFRDLEHILGIITMVWMYMTPIFYSIDMIPEKLRFVYHINPMSSVISCYRDVLYYAQVPDLTSLLEAVVLGALFLVLGMLAFGKLKKGFAEEL